MDYNFLIEQNPERLIDYKFNFENFPNEQSLKDLDDYLDSKFIVYAELNDKSRLLSLTKLLVKSLRLIAINQKNYDTGLIHKLKIKWEHLSKLCSGYLSAKSYKSSYEEIKNNKYDLKIIKYVYSKKSCIVSEIQNEVLKTDKPQVATNLLRKLEEKQIIIRTQAGKNTYVSLTYLGIEIYKEFLKEDKKFDEELKNLITTKSIITKPSIIIIESLLNFSARRLFIPKM